MNRRNNSASGVVYSTDPSFSYGEEPKEEVTLPPAEQPLRIRLETKHRGGKAVTIVDKFRGTSVDAEKLGKALKSFCGTGGSVKETEILVQGDNRQKILQWLQKNGYKLAK